jgi:hypothetical protein
MFKSHTDINDLRKELLDQYDELMSIVSLRLSINLDAEEEKVISEAELKLKGTLESIAEYRDELNGIHDVLGNRKLELLIDFLEDEE